MHVPCSCAAQVARHSNGARWRGGGGGGVWCVVYVACCLHVYIPCIVCDMYTMWSPDTPQSKRQNCAQR